MFAPNVACYPTVRIITKAAPRSPTYLLKFAILSTRTHTSVCTHVRARPRARAAKRARVHAPRPAIKLHRLGQGKLVTGTLHRRAANLSRASAPRPKLNSFFHSFGRRTPRIATLLQMLSKLPLNWEQLRVMLLCPRYRHSMLLALQLQL